MEDLRAHARATEQHVLDILKKPDEPMRNVLSAYNDYRPICQALILADFQSAEREEARLWSAHTEGRKYFHRALSAWRKSNANRPVETRELTKLYLEFLKRSSRFYSDYIHVLSCAAGGIPELEDIAQKVKKGDGIGESLPASIPASMHKQVLMSCHRSLIYLGDLWRYRASEQLDKKAADFGPAIGYYGLAASLMPSSGLGHHQQAVVALSQGNHLRAIYHLYRSILVADPHPAAANNLRLEFDKTNAAWDKGELIHKGRPDDPNASKNALIGWFVRLHSMCFKGAQSRGYEELEREVLAQLSAVTKQRALGDTLLRMVVVNLAAQSMATDRFRDKPDDEHRHQTFLYLFRFNLRFFAALLQAFHDDLRATLLELTDPDAELSTKLTPIMRRLVPALRLYNNWLLTNPIVRMTQVLGNENIVQDAIQRFWPLYARVIDLIAQAFPIWDLDELPDIDYMYEEDVETLGFMPLEDERTRKTWYRKESGSLKKRFSDRDVVRRAADDEDLHKIKDLLADGVTLANNDDDAPIGISQTRVFFGTEAAVEPLVRSAIVQQVELAANPTLEKPKPLSYATAAANGHALRSSQTVTTTKPAYTQPNSQEAQLTRMVDALLDDDDVTESPKLGIHTPNGLDQSMYDSLHGYDLATGHGTAAARSSPRPSAALTPPNNLPSRIGTSGLPTNDIQRLWNHVSQTSSPSMPSGMPVGILGSPATVSMHGHSRVNSASSNRSRSSLNGAGTWARQESASGGVPDLASAASMHSNGSLGQIVGPSPLLFGASDSLWSAVPHTEYRGFGSPDGFGG